MGMIEIAMENWQSSIISKIHRTQFRSRSAQIPQELGYDPFQVVHDAQHVPDLFWNFLNVIASATHSVSQCVERLLFHWFNLKQKCHVVCWTECCDRSKGDDRHSRIREKESESDNHGFFCLVNNCTIAHSMLYAEQCWPIARLSLNNVTLFGSINVKIDIIACMSRIGAQCLQTARFSFQQKISLIHHSAKKSE